jgi:hypothetical protein
MNYPQMKRLLLGAVAFGLAGADGEPLQCNIGPITKTFASVPWLLYSCSDSKSLVMVSAPGSPAAPFYFIFSPEGNGYHLRGEGTGSKSITDVAAKELQNLRDSDIKSLVQETIATKNP